MNIVHKLGGFAAVAGLSAMLAMPVVPAQASEQGRDALLGAGIGAIAGGLLGRGDIGPVLGGAAVGAAIGAIAAPHNKHTGYYYDEYGYRHKYTYHTDRYGHPYDYSHDYQARYYPYTNGYANPYDHGYRSQYGYYGAYGY